MKCALITCEECRELGNETCPYENTDRYTGNTYEVIYNNERSYLRSITIGKKYYLFNNVDTMHGVIGTFKNILEAERYLMKNAILIDKNKTETLLFSPSDRKEGEPRKSDNYIRNFILCRLEPYN